MLGSPKGGRRRRLIETFAPKNKNDYTSVPSFTSSSGSSMRRRRSPSKPSGDSRKQRSTNNIGTRSKDTSIPQGFKPIIDPNNTEHGYRVAVARDGSMITAVPIDKQPARDGGSRFKAPPQRVSPSRRESPILFGASPRSSPNTNESITGSTTWSQQGLLDARGKQRHKMKRNRPIPTTKHTPKVVVDKDSSFPHDPFNNVVHTARDTVHTARDKLKQLIPRRVDNSNNSNQHQKQNHQREERGRRVTSKQPTPPRTNYSHPRKTRVRWDLSPKRQQQQQTPQSSEQVELAKSISLDDASSFSSFPILSPTHKFNSFGEEEKKSNSNENNGDTNDIQKAVTQTQSYEALLQQRMVEIQTQQKELRENISKKDVIKGTLITAIDGNLERNRKQMISLEEELKQIQWHLKLDAKKKKQHKQHIRENVKGRTVDRIEEEITEIRLARSPSGAYDMESVDIGDPSITADTDSVAALYQNDKSSRRLGVTGLDPPARPSPPPTIEEELHHPLYRRETKEPDGPRISSVLRGDQTDIAVDDIIADLERDDERLGKMAQSGRRTPVNLQQQQYQRGQHPWQRKRNNVLPQSQKIRGKFVHFDLPRKTDDSVELKFANSTDTPSHDFVATNNNGRANNNENDLIKDDISWKEEHFDIDAYNESTGSIISSEHHDVYQWTDKEQHVVVSEHYSRENHHRHMHHNIDDTTSPSALNNRINNFNENRGGISSSSVGTDPDLDFVHAVAAVVIQTAVRRFLAEIAFEERMYAVDVIQTAICNWMARKQNQYYYNGEDMLFRNEQNAEEMLFLDEQQIAGEMYHEKQYDPNSYNSMESPQRTKRVMFEDDYQEFRHFAATEIQRWWRGWWARDGLEVDHFAATTIQRVFRGFWVREGLDVDRYCAIECQRIVRGYLARMACIYDLYCIIVVQSVARRYLAFYTSAIRLANILYIQAIYRGYRVRSELMRYVRNGQEVAATFIQSQWRSYDAQMNFINTLADILIVQSVARRWLVLRRMRRRRLATKLKHIKEVGNLSITTNHPHRSKSAPATTPRNSSHAVWQQHRLNIVSKPLSPVSQHSRPPDEFDPFDRESVNGEEWYSGGKSETSDMLKNWKGRKRK